MGESLASGRRVASPAAWAVADALAHAQTKRISAMMRVRNEEEFLGAAVDSIAGLVDEVVIVDNASSDRTPDVIEELVRKYPEIRAFSFPHRVARPGQENLDTVRKGNGAGLERLSTYYNFALDKCRYPFVLKWDGDAVAGPQLRQAWQRWRSGGYLAMKIRGLNTHPDRAHVLAARVADHERLAGMLAGDMLPGWAGDMTHTDLEAWLYPRFLARYGDSLCWWCENLESPFVFWGAGWGHPGERYCLNVWDPVFLHLKYWKRAPHANHSADLQAMIETNMAVGPELPDAWRQVLAEHQLIGG